MPVPNTNNSILLGEPFNTSFINPWFSFVKLDGISPSSNTVREALAVSFNIKATIPLWLLITADLANCLNNISIIANPL